MEYLSEEKQIKLDRQLSNLDKFVLEFIEALKDYTGYVIVSGYVSILFGRTRATEDIDFLTPHISKEIFSKLFDALDKGGFECLNTHNANEAFDMLKEHAIRFAKKGRAVPNIEFKTIKNILDEYSYENKIKVILKDSSLFISPLEMQIMYKKEYLSSQKDIEDAVHLEKLFQDELDNIKLNKSKELIKYIKEKEKNA